MADDTGASGSSASAAGSSPAPTTANTSASQAAQPAAATAPPAHATSAAQDTSSVSGEPPKERWSEILDNARKKTRADVEAEYQQKYGWADQFHSDPYAFVENWIDQLAAHSQYAPQILAKAARLLQSRRGQTTVAEEPQPDVPIQDANGTVTGQTYSAPQLRKWQDWNWAQREQAISQRLQPLEDFRAEITEQRRTAEQQHRSAESATQLLTKYRQSDVFVKNEEAFKAFYAAHEEYGDDVQSAWWEFFHSTVLPTFSRDAQQKVLEQMQTQANAAPVRTDGSGAALPDFHKMKPEAVMKYMHDHPDVAERFANR